MLKKYNICTATLSCQILFITKVYAPNEIALLGPKLIMHPWRFDSFDFFPDVHVWGDDYAPLELKTQLDFILIFFYY